MPVREAIRASLGLLTSRDRRLLLLAMALQVVSSALDLIGVLLMGLVGALAVTTIQSQPAPQVVVSIAEFFGLEGLSDQALVGVFAGTAALVLLIKSTVSAFLNRRVFIFLANRQALVSARLASELLSRPITFLQQRSSQETAYALIQGAASATISILGQLVIIVTELAVLIVLAVALLFIDPWVTLGAIAFFALVALVLHRLMGNWASRLGRTGAEADIASLNTLQDAMSTYREITVLHRRDFYVDQFREQRWKSASVSADRTFVLQVPKYVFEAALVIGGIALGGVLFVTKDSVTAVGILLLFLAAASRVMPSLLRLQGAALTLRDNAAAAVPTFDLAEALVPSEDYRPPKSPQPLQQPAGSTRDASAPIGILVENVFFSYPTSEAPNIRDANLEVQAGSSLALVGPSGSGKSTLADLILGVLEPTRGSVTLSGLGPRVLAAGSPGCIGYVPQSVSLVSGTVRENVALGLPPESVSDEQIWSALRGAHLDSVFPSPTSLNTQIGENGVRLSGGQRQRLGIARAFLFRPRLLVLDEATSALDAETEASIAEVVEELRGKTTVLVIAHRLSTVRSVDKVAYMSNGRIEALGSFASVRSLVPALDRQARLMGLA